jgi:hypothetical protein
MSERFKVTKSEDPNTFPNYGATTGMDADDNHGKMRTETDEKHPPSSLEETIGRKEQKYVHFSHFPQAFAIFTMSVVSACNAFVDKEAHLFSLFTILPMLFYYCKLFVRFSSLFAQRV